LIIHQPTTPLLKRSINLNVAAIIVFIIFILVNTLKLTVFNFLITGSTALPSYADIMKLFWGKCFLVGTAGLVLLRLRWRWLGIAGYCLQTIYITVNLMYFFSFQGYLHVGQYLGLYSEGLDLLTHSALPWDSRSLFIVIDLPLFAAVLYLYPRLAELNKRFFFRPYMYAGSAVFLWFFYKWEPPVELPLQTMNNAYTSDVSVVSQYGLMTFNVMDLLGYADARSHIRQLNFGPVVTAPVVDGMHPNILVIQVESLDANIIDYTYKKEYVTPWLHELSGQSIYFPYAMSYHLAGSSSDCDFSTLNSVEPFVNYPAIKIRNYNYSNCILKQLTAGGYTTAAFHGNRGSYFNRNIAFKKMGFQKFYDIAEMGLPEVGWGSPDEAVFDFVTSRMAQQRQPFFLLCHHHVYARAVYACQAILQQPQIRFDSGRRPSQLLEFDVVF
jgi:lipoteichoic acid synthase